MTPEQIRKLVGGYATGTLTAEEEQTLYLAALEDQELFDELAREQSLRDLLGDPVSRAALLARLDEPAPSWRERITRWMWGHAVGMAAIACFASVGGYVAYQARHAHSIPRVIFTDMKPTVVEVTGSLADGPKAPPKPFDEKRAARVPRVAASPLPVPPVISTIPSPLPTRLAPAAIVDSLAKSSAMALLPAPQTQSDSGMTGAVAETLPSPEVLVEVTASARVLNFAGGSLPAASAGGRAAGAVQDGATATANLGVSVEVLRRTAGGRFEPAPAGYLAAGDTVRLRLTPTFTGYVSVRDASQDEQAEALLAPTLVEARVAALTPEIRLDAPGFRRYTVSYTRAEVDPSPAKPEEAYVAGTPGSASRVSFTVRLTWN